MRGALFAGLVSIAGPAMGCDVALMLAVDVSGSVDPAEYRTQKDGLADALEERAIATALIESRAKVALMQWTGSGRQRVVLEWAGMETQADVVRFAARVREEPRVWRNYSTAIGEALALALEQFALVPQCRRRIVDISGDGPSNEGRSPRDMRQALAAAGVTVNALVIEESEPGLTAYFAREVIAGEGAFAVTANTFDDYPAEIRRKLLRELSRAIASIEK